MQNPAQPQPQKPLTDREQNVLFETLKLTSYIITNQDDSNDDGLGENNNAKVIIAVFILLNIYVLHSQGSCWTWKIDVLMYHC